MDLFWLSDAQWNAIAGHLPTIQTGPKRSDDRIVISGIIHVLRTGCAWRECPPEYGPCMTVFNRYNRWKHRGIWQTIIHTLVTDSSLPPLRMENGASLESAEAERAGQKILRPRAGVYPSRGGAMTRWQRPRTDFSDWKVAAGQVTRLMQENAGRPAPELVEAIVEWHMDKLFERQEQAWVPGMAGAQDPIVEKLVERFHQQHFKMAAERIAAEFAELRRNLRAALACINLCADDPVRNGANARATLQKLLNELARADERQQPVPAKASGMGQ